MSVSIEYARRATYGSAAYDLTLPQFAPPYENSGAEGREVAVPKPKTRTAAQPKRAPYKNAFSPVAIIGLLAAAALLILVLLAYVQLTEIYSNTSQLESQLSTLKSEESKLLVKYETTFNLTEIEEYATSKLGMTHMDSDQVIYVNGEKVDKAVVVDGAGQSGTGFSNFTDFVTSLLEYFR